ncbi:MAG: YIP1 family protein [Candidatus Methanoperedens sp.]|nr:YIP1 family protein [Candidatus Methanoperedens sp.]
MDFLEKVKGFLMEPSKTFDAVRDEPLEEAVKYYAIIAVIYSALFALMFAFVGSLTGSMMGFGSLGTMMGASVGIGAAVIFFVMFLVFAIAGAFIGGVILHIFVYIVGGRKGIAQTIKAGMYGSTPYLLLGWIPFIGFIAAIWSLVVEIVGIRQLHELTTGRAVLAFALLIIVGIILTILLVAVMATFIFGMAGRSPYGY